MKSRLILLSISISILFGQWYETVKIYTGLDFYTDLNICTNSSGQVSLVFAKSSLTKKDELGNYYIADEILVAENENGIWTNPQRLAFLEKALHDVRLSYIIDETDNEYIVWAESEKSQNLEFPNKLMIVTGKDDNWTKPKELYRDPGYDNFWYYDYKVDGNNKQMVYTGRWGIEAIMISEKIANTWKNPYVLFPDWDVETTGTLQTFGDFSYGLDNLLHVVFKGESPTDSALYQQKPLFLYYSEQNADQAWQEPVKIIEKPQRDMAFPEIVVDKNNTRHVLWFDIKWQGFFPENIKYSFSSDGINWNEPIIIDKVERDELIDNKKFVVDNNNKVHIFWRKNGSVDGSTPTKFEYTTIVDGVKGKTETVAEYWDFSAWLTYDIAVDAFGRVHFVWGDVEKEGNEVTSYNILYKYYGEQLEQKKNTKTVKLLIHPNPFNFSTSVSIYPKETMKIEISIYDIKGKLITKLLSDRKVYGSKHITWDGYDKNMNKMPSGIYFVHIQGKTITGKTVNCSQKMLFLQ